MNKLMQFLRKPWLFLGLTAVSYALGIAVSVITPSYPGNGLFPQIRADVDSIQCFAVSPDGLLAVSQYSDTDSYLFCADPDSQQMLWLLMPEDIEQYCGGASRCNVLFGENGELFLHFVRWTEDDNAVLSESVACIKADGSPGRILCGIDYTDADDPPTREPRMTAFRYTEGMLHYVYATPDVTEFYSVDTATGTQTLEGSIPWEDSFAGRIFPLTEDYLLAMSDGTVCRAAEDGTLGEPLYQASVSKNESWDTDMLLSAAELDGRIYVLPANDTQGIYELTEDGLELYLSLYEDSDLWMDTLVSANGTLYASAQDTLLYTEEDTIYEMSPDCRIDSSTLIKLLPFFLYIFLSAAAGIAFVIWLILIPKGLLAKQLLLMIPCISVIVTVLLFTANKCIFALYCAKQTEEMIAVAELCRNTLDGDVLKEIGDTSDPSSYRMYRDILMGFSGYNRGNWNGGLDFTLCIPCDDCCSYVYADSIRMDNPFTKFDYECYPDVFTLFPAPNTDVCSFTNVRDSTAFASLLGTNETDYVTIAPVYASDGSVSAYLKISTDHFYFRVDKYSYTLTLLAAAIPLSLLLLILTSVIAVIMSHSLRRATVTVNKIADGDFSVRNHAKSRDEIGEICRQVDKMADNLSALFEEKDANERFYYKFVPEKFRELLGKEKLTDLELGDAESREFTVLFCDIRSFSLNSEMLTVKENFEFVNIIYGIAGPIIREHGGFVDKYIGDAVMALFESADAAVSAGIALYHAIVLDPSTAEKLRVSEINIGIGIHTGMARIGIVGEDERLSGTVISDTVNLSSRLESLTKVYQTAMLISKETLDKMEHPEAISMRYLGMVQVAGVNEVHSLYEVLDCLDENRRNVRTADSGELREAIRLFHLGKRSEAAAILTQLTEQGTADPTVPMYLEYLRNLSDDDKGNVFRFVRK